MIRVLLLRCFGVLFPSMAILVSPAWAQQQRLMLHELALTHTDHEVLLYMHLQGGFHPELLEAIESGIPITVTFYMKLYRKRGLWFDEEVLSKTIKHMVKYETLKKQYRISEINGLFSSIKVTKHEPTMVRWMSEIEGQPLIPFHLLQPGEEYYVKAMADLQAVKSPFPLSHILFLASLWDMGTPWTVSSPFTLSTPQPQR
jgi:Domain of unknown function (DUF4390)